ncbi:hypothetical protein [Nonomuraea sp. NPDC001023]|uniref:hypothetical protein n=1 Tax=unclassified Nonomuraea TaxID=2593643 RepID=UPI003317E0BD
MKVYLATSGPPGEYGYQVLGAFTRRKDAQAFKLADRVEPFELWDGPVEVRDRHVITWFDSVIHGPKRSSYQQAYTADEDSETSHGWRTVFETFDRDRADARFSEWQAAHEQRAAAFVASLDRIDVQVWYEPGDGNTLVRTPLHLPEVALRVPRDLITDQAGLPRGATLHGQWFTVETLTLDHVDGFAVCRHPQDRLAALPMATPSPSRLQS